MISHIQHTNSRSTIHWRRLTTHSILHGLCVHYCKSPHQKTDCASPTCPSFKKKSSTGGVVTTRQTFHAVYDKMTTFLYKNMILNNVLNNGSQSVRHSRALRVKKRELNHIGCYFSHTFKLLTDLYTFELPTHISTFFYITWQLFLPFAFHYSVLVD